MSLSNQKVKEIKLLRMAADKGMIDLDKLNAAIQIMKEREYLSKHDRSIWQGKNGYWYTRIDGRLIKKKKKDDLDKLLVAHYQKEEEDLDPTFKTIYERWIKQKQELHEVKDNSILRYEDDYRRYIKDTTFENTAVSEIDDIILDEFIRKTISEAELTAKAYACLRTVIIGVMKYAKRYHFTSFSVSTFFKDFQVSKTAFKKPSNKRSKVYLKSEREALYEHLMSNPTIENLGLSLMCLTGLRVGELASLKKEDNVSSCKLFIHRTETRVKKDGKVRIEVHDSAKMGHDDVIILPKAAQRIIDITKMRTHDEEYLFSKNGKRITARMFRHYLKKACDELEITYRPPHQMRKTYASILLAAGVDEAIVKKEMRHTDIATTRAYYQFITENDDEEKELIDRVTGI